MCLTQIGEIAYECWQNIPEHFPNVQLDQSVIMPNHMHGIIVICSNVPDGDVHRRGVQLNAPTNAAPDDISKPRNPNNPYSMMSPKRDTLSVIVRTYKSAVTTQCRKMNYHHFAWQRNYYEHIIRSEESLYKLQEYIMNNPKKWEVDQLHPNNPSKW